MKASARPVMEHHAEDSAELLALIRLGRAVISEAVRDYCFRAGELHAQAERFLFGCHGPWPLMRRYWFWLAGFREPRADQLREGLERYRQIRGPGRTAQAIRAIEHRTGWRKAAQHQEIARCP